MTQSKNLSAPEAPVKQYPYLSCLQSGMASLNKGHIKLAINSLLLSQRHTKTD